MPKITDAQSQRLLDLAQASLRFHEARIAPEFSSPHEEVDWHMKRGRLVTLIPYDTVSSHSVKLRALLEEIHCGEPS